jgi:hypothetical protein
MGGNDDEQEECVDGDTVTIPVLTLAYVSTLLAPLLRQTALARFPTVARAPSSGTIDGSDNSFSSSSSSLLSSPARPVPTEALWAHVHAAEAPSVRTWWAAIDRRLPKDAAFSTTEQAGLAAAGASGGVFDVPGVRRQIDGLLLSAEAMSAHAFNLRFSAKHERFRSAQLCATLCGM